MRFLGLSSFHPDPETSALYEESAACPLPRIGARLIDIEHVLQLWRTPQWEYCTFRSILYIMNYMLYKLYIINYIIYYILLYIMYHINA